MSKIDDKTRYEFITSQIVYFNEKIIEAFSLYIKLFTAIIGGFMWLKTQDLIKELEILQTVVPGLLAFIALGSILLIIFNLSAWYGFRKAEYKLLDEEIPKPRFPKSMRQEILFIITIIASCTIAIWFLTKLP